MDKDNIEDFTDKEFPPVKPGFVRLGISLPCGCTLQSDIPEENIFFNSKLTWDSVTELGKAAVETLQFLQGQPHAQNRRN